MAILTLGDQDVRVVRLESSREQSQGFMGYNEIPTDYCLMFPGCGGMMFHMFSVGAPLLIVAVRSMMVLDKQIREPNSPPRRIGTQGDDIYEFNPIYLDEIRVGERLGTKRKAQSKTDIQRIEIILKQRLGPAYYFLSPEEKRSEIERLLRKPRRA